MVGAVASVAAIFSACRQSAVNPDSNGIAAVAAYRVASAPGATLTYSITSWTIDSDGTSHDAPPRTTTLKVLDTAALCPNHLLGIALQRVSTKRTDTLHVCVTPDGRDLVLFSKAGDTIGTRVLQMPFVAGRCFKSVDSLNEADFMIDTVEASLNMPSVAVKTIRRKVRMPSPDCRDIETTNTMYLPGYWFVYKYEIHERTTLSSGKTETIHEVTMLTSAAL